MQVIINSGKKVIFCENVLSSIEFKEALCEVLFTDFKVPRVSFFSTPWLALFATGRPNGLIIDVGNLETVVMPVWTSDAGLRYAILIFLAY
jgi:actin-related protein 10